MRERDLEQITRDLWSALRRLSVDEEAGNASHSCHRMTQGVARPYRVTGAKDNDLGT
jgi:hypothetical protein